MLDFVEVVLGILIKEDNSFLMTNRPKGKIYEGFWEFPGGKIEENENLNQTLKRELKEELNIQVLDYEFWKVLYYKYPHANVKLHCFKVKKWQNELKNLENQVLSWQKFPIESIKLKPILEASILILQDLEQELKT